MPSFEWNKIIASILAALIVAMGAGLLADLLVAPTKLKKPVFLVAGAPAAAPAAKPAAGPAPIAPLLAKASVKKGQALTAVCQACHTFTKGGANGIGPNLYGIYGAKMAEDRKGYEFSSAIEKHKGTVLDAATLNIWLTDPQKFAPGTKMTFPGIKKDQDRADVIAYLHSISPGAPALPKATAAAAAKPAPAAAKPAASGIGALLKKADVKKGQALTAICQACHTFTKGGANRIGPNLYGVYGAKMAEDRNGYQFSSALKKHKGTILNAATLNTWLTDPQKFAPGTKMTFVGFPKIEDRADVIAYLETLK